MSSTPIHEVVGTVDKATNGALVKRQMRDKLDHDLAALGAYLNL